MRYLKPIYKLVVYPLDTQYEPQTLYSMTPFDLKKEITYCMETVGACAMNLETIHVGLNPLSLKSDTD